MAPLLRTRFLSLDKPALTPPASASSTSSSSTTTATTVERTVITTNAWMKLNPVATLRRFVFLLLGVGVTEKALVYLNQHLIQKCLAYLCQRHRALDEDGGFYCSAIPFAKSLSTLTTRVVCYSMLVGRYMNIDVKSVLSGVGVYGLVIGWALNQVLKEAVSGALIVTNQPVQVGQKIIVRTQMMNFEGVVDAITLQHTVLTSGKGPGDEKEKVGNHTVLIPNSVLLNAVVRIVNVDEETLAFSDYGSISSPGRESQLNKSGFIDL